MRSEALTVDSYLGELPSDRRGPLTQLRTRCRQLLVGFDETMAYGMPSYTRDGTVEIAFASQKAYISLYVLRTDVFDRHRGTFDRASLGKGVVRFRSPERIDMRVIEAILRDTASSPGQVC
jgi:uncharacterized protein YdhG (YjbR/CyaY superfamily)